jgi:hypothetical protein
VTEHNARMSNCVYRLAISFPTFEYWLSSAYSDWRLTSKLRNAREHSRYKSLVVLLLLRLSGRFRRLLNGLQRLSDGSLPAVHVSWLCDSSSDQ